MLNPQDVIMGQVHGDPDPVRHAPIDPQAPSLPAARLRLHLVSRAALPAQCLVLAVVV